MSREIALHELLGRMVHDREGRKLGRVEELCAELETREDGSDYVVTEIHVGSFGALESLAGVYFTRLLLRRLGRLARYELRRIRWSDMDLSDPHRPRVLRKASELPPG